MKKVIILIMTLLCALAHISAQNTYTARVVDATTGDALPMASVYISSSHSTITNQEGDFSIKAHPEDMLHITYVGYNGKNIKASDLGRKVAPHDDDLAQGEQLMMDHLDGLSSHQSVAVAGEEHWSVHHRLGLVTPQGTHNGFQYLRVSNHTYLHRLGHHIIDDGVELSADNGSRQIIEMLDTQGILQGHRGDDRHSLGAECRYRGDVGLNARSTCAVATRDGKYCRITH